MLTASIRCAVPGRIGSSAADARRSLLTKELDEGVFGFGGCNSPSEMSEMHRASKQFVTGRESEIEHENRSRSWSLREGGVISLFNGVTAVLFNQTCPRETHSIVCSHCRCRIDACRVISADSIVDWAKYSNITCIATTFGQQPHRHSRQL